MDPASAIGPGLNASIKIFELIYQFKAVEQQTSDLLSTTGHVDHDVNEARRLRRLKVALLSAGERAWMDGVIDHTEDALRAVAKLIEPARVNKSIKQGINFGNKIMWVFRDNPQVQDKHQRLAMCHQSLTAVISCLYSKDLVVIAPMVEDNADEQPPPYDPQMQQLFDWRHRKRSHTSLKQCGNRAVESPSPTNSRSISPASINPNSPDRLSSQADLNEELSKPCATIPEPQAQSLTSNLFQHEGRHVNESPFLSPPTSSHDLNRQSHSSRTSTALTAHVQMQPPHDPSRRATLSEIDSHPLTTMPTDTSPGHDPRRLQPHRPDPTPDYPPLWSPQLHPSVAPFAVVSSSTPATGATLFPYLPPPSELSSGSAGTHTTRRDNRFDWPTSSGKQQCGGQPEATLSRAVDQQVAVFGVDKDGQGLASYQNYWPNAVASVRTVGSEEGASTVARRGTGVGGGGRSWLVYHATRSDLGYGVGSDGNFG